MKLIAVGPRRRRLFVPRCRPRGETAGEAVKCCSAAEGIQYITLNATIGSRVVDVVVGYFTSSIKVDVAFSVWSVLLLPTW